jgi:hypothetical protein
MYIKNTSTKLAPSVGETPTTNKYLAGPRPRQGHEYYTALVLKNLAVEWRKKRRPRWRQSCEKIRPLTVEGCTFASENIGVYRAFTLYRDESFVVVASRLYMGATSATR